jgi:hypothetical protein
MTAQCSNLELCKTYNNIKKDFEIIFMANFSKHSYCIQQIMKTYNTL